MVFTDDEPMTCEHEEFEAHVAVNRFSDKKPLCMADIKIRCKQCLLPFHFCGVDFGISFHKPMVDIVGTELRVPILPGELPLDITSDQFKVEM